MKVADLGYEEVFISAETRQKRDIVQFIPLNTNIFDNISVLESSGSELSEPFSDPVYDPEIEKQRKAKAIIGGDLQSVFSFSQEYKTVVEELRKSMNSEVEENIFPISSNSESSKKMEWLPVGLLFQSSDLETFDESELSFEKGGKKRAVRDWEYEETVFDTMSGYWRLLSCHDNFRISPPWYDAYAYGQKHWLQTKPIPQKVLEASTEKCIDWLNKYFPE